LEGFGPLAAVVSRKLTPFHGADGADALQGIGQQCPSGCGNDDRRRLGGFEVWGLGFGVWGLEFGVWVAQWSEFCILYSALQGNSVSARKDQSSGDPIYEPGANA
jgi:hypothetical protein